MPNPIVYEIVKSITTSDIINANGMTDIITKTVDTLYSNSDSANLLTYLDERMYDYA